MSETTLKKDNSALVKSLQTLGLILLATIFGLLAGAFVIILSGSSPLEVYAKLFGKAFIDPYYFMSTLTRSSPIIVCGIATAMAWRAGYINIGVEGQMIFGGFASTIAAIYIPGPAYLIFPLSIIIGMIVGALYASIAAIINYHFSVSIVISTLMMNYIASYITSYFVEFPFKDPTGNKLAAHTREIGKSFRFTRLTDNGFFNIGFILTIVIVLVFLYVSRKTIFGYESKMTGLNKNFAKYGGVKEKKNMYITMALSGAIAALAGIIEINGVVYRYADGMFTSTSYAWTGLMANLIANLNPIGIFFTGIFLSGLQVGGQAIQITTAVPVELSTVIQSCITLFVSAKFFTKFIRKNQRNKLDRVENIKKKVDSEINEEESE